MKPQQQAMFTHEDLPLFSGTAPKATDAPYIPDERPTQGRLPGTPRVAMTRRERLENKQAKREEWAAKAAARSTQRFDAAHQLADQIPFGQPILCGHHSERHARRDADRIAANMDKGVEEHKLAEHHADKAMGLESQLERSVFSDDADAIEQLEARIAENETQSAAWVTLNKAWRKAKGDVAAFAELTGLSESTVAQIAETIAKAYSWEKQPIPAYRLTNLRARIRADRERIEEIRARQARTERAETAGGVSIEGEAWVRVTFAEKPDRAILDALKAAGFRWSGGSWIGERVKLPDGIAQ